MKYGFFLDIMYNMYYMYYRGDMHDDALHPA